MIENPALGTIKGLASVAATRHDGFSDGRSVIWLRNDLETLKKRLKGVRGESCSRGVLLTEEQVKLLERTKQEKEAHGEIETSIQVI